MRYLPHTPEEIEAMLATVGKRSVEGLMADAIPTSSQFHGTFDLPPALSEDELLRHLRELSEQNLAGISFAGAGVYDHTSPVVVDTLIQRGEFLTAYTPYQPEVSQGTLMAIYEFQTMVAQLYGVEVANASMHDGGSAAAEACLMARRLKPDRDVIVLSAGLHPHYRQVIETYLSTSGARLIEAPLASDGTTDLDAVSAAEMEQAAAVLIQSPNFFGCVEDNDSLFAAANAAGALRVGIVAEAASLGLLKPPGASGADIVCGEGQSLGIPTNFGGPNVGLFGSRAQHSRALPGRLVGETVDSEGERGYVLTLATREQHIRRERATSNICTNQGLMALVATIYMSLMGPRGMRRIAELNLSKSRYALGQLTAIAGVTLPFSAATFNEFVFETRMPASELLDELSAKDIVGGLDLGRWHPQMRNRVLVAVTERRTRADIDQWAKAIREVLK